MEIRNATAEELVRVGQILVDVYSNIDGFPQRAAQPAYYEMLSNVSALSSKPEMEVVVAVSEENQICGAVVFCGDVKYYGSGGTATQEPNASGFRLLAVAEHARGKSIGKMLTLECIRRARLKNNSTLIIHTTQAMNRAWMLYEKIGFVRAPDLDFIQGDLPVFGFRFDLRRIMH